MSRRTIFLCNHVKTVLSTHPNKTVRAENHPLHHFPTHPFSLGPHLPCRWIDGSSSPLHIRNYSQTHESLQMSYFIESKPDDPSSNPAGGILYFFAIFQIYPNFKGNFLVAAKFSDRGAKSIVKGMFQRHFGS